MTISSPLPVAADAVRAGVPAAPDGRPRFFNRELSWLEFDARVVDEACNPAVPLLERVKFLAISASNLDEFYMVRVAGLRREKAAGATGPTSDGFNPAEQLLRIHHRVRLMARRQYACLNRQLRPALAAEGVRWLSPAELTAADRAVLDRFHERTLSPVLTPLAVDAAHPFPVLVNNGLYVAAELEPASDGTFPSADLVLVQVPPVLPRFVTLPAAKSDSAAPAGTPAAPAPERRLLALEDVIRLYLPELVRGARVVAAHCFRVTRDSDLVLDEEGVESLPDAIQEEIRQRRHGAAVKLEVETGMGPALRARLAEALDVTRDEVHRLPAPLHLTGLMELVDLPVPDRLRDAPLPPLPVHPHPEPGETWFDVVARGDVLMHHPYQSFDPVLELVAQAADDPHVLAIKQTLYRTAKDSRIIRSLVRAAERGKQVAVLMELKARFDEERNLDWARELEDAGAHVIYGVAGLKVHCKALLVIRREPDGIRRYVHLSTGNYNERTARIYTDLGLLTARPEYGEDVSALFNVITGYSRPPAWNVIAMAPTDMARKVVALIRREAELSSPAAPGLIIGKLNSLVDDRVIDALYDASRAGVRVELVVRGICRLRPGVPGLSDNIRVVSVVDRFLEHSRIYWFRNGGDEECHLASADWMQRNLHKRIEVMFPLPDDATRRRAWTVLQSALADTDKAWELRPDGTYRRRTADGEPCRSQVVLYREAEALVDRRRQERAARFQPVTAGK